MLAFAKLDFINYAIDKIIDKENIKYIGFIENDILKDSILIPENKEFNYK